MRLVISYFPAFLNELIIRVHLCYEVRVHPWAYLFVLEKRTSRTFLAMTGIVRAICFQKTLDVPILKEVEASCRTLGFRGRWPLSPRRAGWSTRRKSARGDRD